MVNSQQELKKILGRWDSIAIIIAIVIGVGIYRAPAEIAKYLSSPCLILLAWFLGGVISLLGALCYAELSSSFPKTGGNYVYFRESYGPWAGFLFGWTELLVIRTGSIAAVSFIFAEYLQSFLSMDKCLIKPAAIFVVIFLSLINIIGLRYGKRIQDVFTITKISIIMGVILLGFISKKGNIVHFHSVPITIERKSLSLFSLALIPVLWTYGGWHENTFVGGETRDAKRNLPLALIIGILIVSLLYLAINFLYIYLIPVDKIAYANLIASDVFHILFGKNGKKVFEALVIISSLGCINAMIITGSRITYALAEDNIIFRYLGKVNNKYCTPHWAIILNGIWSIILIILGTFNKLLFFTGVVVWLFFALVGGALFILRYKFPEIERPYKVCGYPFLPAIFILISIALVINTIIFYPFQSFMGLSLLITGIPIFIISQKKSNSRRPI